MMVMTAKVDLKKILTVVGIVAAAIVAAILLFGENDTAATSAPGVANNDARVQFLKDFGWEVAASPVESSQVRIPEQTSEVYDRYNQLQKSQGYDLSAYAGKTAMRFVYKVNNYPGATEPVYATLLVYKNRIIGGDITDTSAQGQVRGFKMPEGAHSSTAPTQPTEPTVSSGAET